MPLKPQNKLTVAEAIARQEGFALLGARATRNCNPGNINFGSFAKSHGATGEDRAGVRDPTQPGYAIFPDNQTGRRALEALLRTKYKGFTLEALVGKYCPAGDPRGETLGKNEPSVYVRNVCQWTGLTPETIIDEHI